MIEVTLKRLGGCSRNHTITFRCIKFVKRLTKYIAIGIPNLFDVPNSHPFIFERKYWKLIRKEVVG